MPHSITALPDRRGQGVDGGTPGVAGPVPGAAGPVPGAAGWIPRQRCSTDQTIAPTMAPWVPAIRVGARPREMLTGVRLFAGLAALVVLTRRGAA